MSYKYTKISDLITELETIKKSHGDIPVCTPGDYGWLSFVYAAVQPYYYDGGYHIQDGMGANGKPNFISSRKIDLNNPVNQNLNSVVKLMGFYFDEDQNFNNTPIRQIIPTDFTWLDEMEQETRMKFGGEIPKYRNLKFFDKTLNCYPIEASLENGLSAQGGSTKDAEDNLAKKFLMQDPNILLKEKL